MWRHVAWTSSEWRQAHTGTGIILSLADSVPNLFEQQAFAGTGRGGAIHASWPSGFALNRAVCEEVERVCVCAQKCQDNIGNASPG